MVYRQALLDEPHLHPQELVNLAHPLTVTPGQVIIDGYDLAAAKWACWISDQLTHATGYVHLRPGHVCLV